jgi:hypothetical protein
VKEYQLIDLFERIKRQYPTFTTDRDKRDEWLRLLAHVSYEQANLNLDRYLLQPDSRFAPHPGILAVEADQEMYTEQMRQAGMQTQQDWQAMMADAVPPPPDIRRRVREMLAVDSSSQPRS